jgi:hypothetical protein
VYESRPEVIFGGVWQDGRAEGPGNGQSLRAPGQNPFARLVAARPPTGRQDPFRGRQVDQVRVYRFVPDSPKEGAGPEGMPLEEDRRAAEAWVPRPAHDGRRCRDRKGRG